MNKIHYFKSVYINCTILFAIICSTILLAIIYSTNPQSTFLWLQQADFIFTSLEFWINRYYKIMAVVGKHNNQEILCCWDGLLPFVNRLLELFFSFQECLAWNKMKLRFIYLWAISCKYLFNYYHSKGHSLDFFTYSGNSSPAYCEIEYHYIFYYC